MYRNPIFVVGWRWVSMLRPMSQTHIQVDDNRHHEFNTPVYLIQASRCTSYVIVWCPPSIHYSIIVTRKLALISNRNRNRK